MFSTPILFIVFNRPDVTTRVFAEIKKLKPKQLFIVSDGPRPNRLDDIDNCAIVRKIIEDGIDWECDVKKLFFETNHGCGQAPFLAIDWFFKTVEEGIILEDDCLPHPSFFGFCQELLEKYRYESKIMMISGDNFQNGINRGEYSYYFSHHSHTWGWASWRRAWKYFDFNMEVFPVFQEKRKIRDIWTRKIDQKYWLNIFKNSYKNLNKDFWDYQWTFAIWNNGGISCSPNVNLVSNIGFGEVATHTFFRSNKMMVLPVQAVALPLSHPLLIRVDKDADEYENIYIFKIRWARLLLVKIFKSTILYSLFKRIYFKFFVNLGI